MSNLLRLLKTNERPWANRSGRSEEMSDREQIPQVAQDKWATVSDLLSSLRGNERMSDSLKIFWLKIKNLVFSMYYLRFKKKLLKKLANCSFPLFWWVMWVNCSGRSPQMSKWVNHSFFWVNRSFANFWAKNKRFARKSDEQIPSPANVLVGKIYLLFYSLN